MRKAFFVALLCGVFLLMLSALVVATPEDASGEAAAPVIPGNIQAALMPAPSSLPDQAGTASARPQSERVLLMCVLSAALCCLPALLSHDANGRVLSAMRYENSFYQVFRAEVAGG